VLWGIGVASAMGCASADGGAGSRGGRVGAAAPTEATSVGQPAPDLVVERLDGRPLALSTLKGKVVLLDVWASWCVPCKQELPMLDAMAGRLRARGVEILAVSIDQERANLTKFLAARPRWTLTIAHDDKGAIADALQPDKMPTSYVIDRAGIVRYINSGFVPSDAPAIERRLADLAR
jgi:cytochrome c biogenesis protein CcmG/thiol:disulfide interchange protein DsbE